LKFPRLLLGATVTRVVVDYQEAMATREEVIKAAVPDRRRLKKLLRETVPILGKVVDASEGTRFLLGLAV
jgi:hypothetical protein